MADFASFTHKWRATSTTQSVNADKVTKRNRAPVSCQPCRVRKLKCNKGHPCEACSKRNEADGCVYGKVAFSVPVNNRKDESRSSTLKAQERLNRLEDLVRSMVESSELDRKRSDVQNLDHAVDTAVTRAAADGGNYVGATHWSAILEHIHDLKNDINAHPDGFEEDVVDNSKPDALFGDHRPPSLQHVLSVYLPPRIQVDRRVSQYFNARYLVIPFLHAKQFQRQYEKFWLDTDNANPLWVSILFAVCSLAATLNCWSINPPNVNSQIRDNFATAAGQCLVLGNYSKPQPFVVDALSLFLQCKMFSALDPQKEVALIFSIQTRMAYLMGYHRDGSNFPAQFTPFETEMRRRSWAMIKQFDLMASFQLGLPSNIIPETWDTHLPGNLLDADFDEDTKVLPPPRHENEVTHMLYFLAKTRIMDVYAKICHNAISFPKVPPTYDDILKLDAELRKQVDVVPQSLRNRPVSQSITDQPSDVMVRVNLLFLWRKSLCVLHRKYIATTGNEYSYATCLESASAMCETINDLFPEFMPGGTFEKDGWMIHSLTTQEFLFAVTMLCLLMSVSRKRRLDLGGSVQEWLDSQETRTTLAIIDKAQLICNDLKERSKEVRRVSRTVSAMLERFRSPETNIVAGKHNSRPNPDLSNGTARSSNGSRTYGMTSGSDAPDISPLAVSDGPVSVSISSQPDWFGPDRAFSTPSNASPYGRDVQLMSTIYTPSDIHQAPFVPDQDVELSRSNDIAFGPFSHIITGSSIDNLSGIDWTSFDQFASSYGNTEESAIFSQPETIASRATDANNQAMDYADWESSPPYNLGGRARDPVTGRSQQP